MDLKAYQLDIYICLHPNTNCKILPTALFWKVVAFVIGDRSVSRAQRRIGASRQLYHLWISRWGMYIRVNMAVWCQNIPNHGCMVSKHSQSWHLKGGQLDIYICLHPNTNCKILPTALFWKVVAFVIGDRSVSRAHLWLELIGSAYLCIHRWAYNIYA
jgi:hypothetical protein